LKIIIGICVAKELVEKKGVCELNYRCSRREEGRVSIAVFLAAESSAVSCRAAVAA
jgi:hypothetical protein